MNDLNNKPEIEEEKKETEEENNNKVSPPNNIHPRISPIAAAFLGLIGGFILYQFVGGALTILIFGLNLQNAPVDSVRLMTIAGQILFILLPALIFAKMCYEDVTEIIRFKRVNWEEILLFVAGLIILFPLLQYYIAIQTFLIDKLAVSSHFVHSIKHLLDKVNDLVDKTYGNLLAVHNVLDGALVILVVSIVPAICEETMFRGFIQRSFEFKLKPIWAALITAVFFGLYHFNPYGLIPLIILGFYFGFAVYKSDSIFTSMSLHFLNNFTAVIFFFIYGDQDVINASVDKGFDLGSSILILLGLVILFSGVIVVINRYYSRKEKT
jgi:CAAX protease family protein